MLTIDLSSETIEEGLTEVFYQAYMAQQIPGLATLDDIFKTNTSGKHSEYDLRVAGPGEFPEKGETSNIHEDYEEEKYKTTYTYTEFANSVPVSYAYIKDQLYSIIGDKVGRLGLAARHTQYKNGFSLFRRANNSSYTGADGSTLVASDHPTESAGNQTNVVSSDLSLSALQDAFEIMQEQVDDRNISIPQMPTILLVASKRFHLAKQITKSEKEYDSANNALNWVSSIYPNLRVIHTPYIGANYDGDDENWFLISDQHRIKRYIRFALMTWLNDFKQSRNMVSYFNAHYGESTGWSDYIGVVGGNADWS